MRRTDPPREQLAADLRHAYEAGASIRALTVRTGRSYGAVHALLRESGAVMRSRGGPNRRASGA